MYAAQTYFARSYFGGVFPGLGGELTIYPTGISEYVDFGTPTIQLSLQKLFPTGIEQSVLFGTPRIDLEISPEGIEQLTAFGVSRIDLEAIVTGIVQAIEFGTPEIQVEVTGITIRPTGIEQGVEFGTPDIRLQISIIRPDGIEQHVELGIPYIYAEEVFVPPYPLEVAARLIKAEEFAHISSRTAPAPAKFKTLIEKIDEIIAEQGIGETEMARTIKVTVKQDTTGQIISTSPIAVESLPISPQRLDTLNDVNAATEVEGSVPRYDEATGKYVVEKLDFADITGDPGELGIDEIDGGEF